MPSPMMTARVMVAGVFASAACMLYLAWPLASVSQTALSPIYGVAIPNGYRQWEYASVAHETEPLNELRAVLGNAIAMDAYKRGALPFPDGSVLVKLACKQIQSDEPPPAVVPGDATTVHVMVKDSKRYAATGGWGFNRFRNGAPADHTEHETCFACHEANVKAHDFVFTRLAR